MVDVVMIMTGNEVVKMVIWSYLGCLQTKTWYLPKNETVNQQYVHICNDKYIYQ